MRILALVTEAFGGRGGIARFNQNLLLALHAHQDSPEIIAVPRMVSPFADKLPARLSWRGEGAGSKAVYLATVGRLAREARRSPGPGAGLDLIICGHINLVPAACLARWVAGRRQLISAVRPAQPRIGHAFSRVESRPAVVLTIHGIEAWSPPRLPLKFWCLRGVDAVIAVSQLTHRRFVAWSGFGPKLRFILPNCVNLEEFCPGPKSDVLLDRYGLRGTSVILTLARLHPSERYKGVDEVLAVMPRLREFNVCYLVAGEGADRSRLMAKARSLGLSVLDFESSKVGSREKCLHDVIFTGYVSEEEKPDHYRLADAFVMAGTGEGFGIVYLEALASGIPVVGSRADAGREVLEGCSSAFLVDPTRAAEIESGILQALGCRHGVVPQCVASFSQANFVRRTHRILDSISSTDSLRGVSEVR